jgi:hypothetical protein
MTAYSVLVGASLLLALFVDVFFTVFHSGGRGGPISHRLNRWSWKAVRAVSTRSNGSVREGIANFGGPWITVSTLVVWMFLLIAAFALIYYPFIESFLLSTGTRRAPWAEAIYYSGYNAATLGLGDLIADSIALRLLSVFQALAGFAILSVSITYLLAVYRELLMMRTLAVSIDAYFRTVDVVGLASWDDDPPEALARWAEWATNMLLHALQAHFQYPILHYFRASERKAALPVQLARLLDLRREARTDHPSFAALRGAVEDYIGTVENSFIPAEAKDGRPDNSFRDDTERAHHRLLTYMLY